MSNNNNGLPFSPYNTPDINPRNNRQPITFKRTNYGWWYVFEIIAFILIFLLIAGFIVLLILVIGLYNDDDADNQLPIVAVPYSQYSPNDTQQIQIEQQTVYYSPDIDALKAQIHDLEQRINSLSLLQGPKGEDGVCNPSDCTVGVDDLVNVDTLDVNGNSNLIAPTIATNDVAVRIQKGDLELLEGSIVAKGVIASQTNLLGPPSDKRIKKDVEQRNIMDSINAILQLNPVSYNYTDEWMTNSEREHQHEIGFIAQEYAQVYPYGVDHIYNSFLDVDDFHLLNQRVVLADAINIIKALVSNPDIQKILNK